MKLVKRFACSSIVIILACCLTGSASPHPTSPFDHFGDINCEDEMARLDNFVVHLQQNPNSQGAILFYAGKMAGNRLPRRGEAEARMARIKSYLFNRRGVPADRVNFINGGYAKYFLVQLWMVPPGVLLPQPELHLNEKVIRFRKGKVYPRHVRCNI